jgi:hypothetical protein
LWGEIHISFIDFCQCLRTASQNAHESENKAMNHTGVQHPDRGIRQSFPIRGRVRGWFFRVEELPTGYWQVKGRDRHGQTVSCVGVSPEDVLESAETEATILSNSQRVRLG